MRAHHLQRARQRGPASLATRGALPSACPEQRVRRSRPRRLAASPPAMHVPRLGPPPDPQLPSDLASYTIDPAAIRARMPPPRDPAAVIGPSGVDAYVAAGLEGRGGGGGKLAGSWRAFTWDEGMGLVEEEGRAASGA